MLTMVQDPDIVAVPDVALELEFEDDEP
jgi:hypothetical protein